MIALLQTVVAITTLTGLGIALFWFVQIRYFEAADVAMPDWLLAMLRAGRSTQRFRLNTEAVVSGAEPIALTVKPVHPELPAVHKKRVVLLKDLDVLIGEKWVQARPEWSAQELFQFEDEWRSPGDNAETRKPASNPLRGDRKRALNREEAVNAFFEASDLAKMKVHTERVQ